MFFFIYSFIVFFFFFFNDTATTEIYTAQYTLSLHDALPIYAHELGEQPADHLLDGRPALAKVLEDDADEPAVHPSGEAADDREVPVDVGGPTDDLLDLSHVAIGIWERRTLRTTHNDEEKPTIVVGDQLVLQASRRENKK